MPGQFLTESMLPVVADELYAICQEFGCDLRWVRDSRDKPGAIEEFHAVPIIPSHSSPYGTKMNVVSDIWYGEFQWKRLMRGASLDRGRPEGYVKLRASLDAFMSVSKGLDLFDKTDDGMQRFLCWADEYELADGSVCFRLNTNAGFLWVRGADHNGIGTCMLHMGIADEDSPPRPKGHSVVELVEYNFCRNIGGEPFYEQTPWEGMKSKDSTGRQWHIVKDSLSLYCALRLNVVGRYNDRLKDRPRHVVQRPYQTSWEQWVGDDKKLLIPLDYF
jgi:hypothetical protein